MPAVEKSTIAIGRTIRRIAITRATTHAHRSPRVLRAVVVEIATRVAGMESVQSLALLMLSNPCTENDSVKDAGKGLPIAAVTGLRVKADLATTAAAISTTDTSKADTATAGRF